MSVWKGESKVAGYRIQPVIDTAYPAGLEWDMEMLEHAGEFPKPAAMVSRMVGYRTQAFDSDRVVASRDRGRLVERLATELDRNVVPRSMLVDKIVVCRRSIYLAFSSGECLKIPRESVWRRVHVEGVRGVLFQAGPALLFYLAWRWRCPVVAELMATVKRVSVDPERG